MTERNIVTLKWGDRYSADYVNRLYAAVSRHLSGEFRFVCFTDDARGLHDEIQCFDIPEIDVPEPLIQGGWRKLCLFRDDLPISGDCLFLDLDIIVAGELDKFFTYAPDKIPIIHNWVSLTKTALGKRPDVGNSSVFRFKANECQFVVDQYLSERDWALATFSPPQTYLTHCIRERMVFWPEEWCRSFKRHCRPQFPLNYFRTPRIPQNASIIAFHGTPDPHQVISGYRDGKPHHTVLATPWVSEHWQ